jgi:hypothetical protein
MKADRTVQRELRQLRRYIDAHPMTVESKVAYVMECAIRWAREDGIRGWPPPTSDVEHFAESFREMCAKERAK